MLHGSQEHKVIVVHVRQPHIDLRRIRRKANLWPQALRGEIVRVDLQRDAVALRRSEGEGDISIAV